MDSQLETNPCPSHPSQPKEFLCPTCKKIYCMTCFLKDEDHRTIVKALSKQLLDIYEFEQYLGAGSFGSVFKVSSFSDGLNYALKVMTDIKTEEEFKNISRETQLHAKMSHPNIIKYCNSFRIKKENLFVVVLELADTSLVSELPTISQPTSLIYFTQIIEALKYLHEELKITHRDLKPRNILVKEGKIKLCDMGEARQMSKGMLTLSRGIGFGTIIYLPPEVLNGKQYNEKSDIWAAGIVFHAMMSNGKHPFNLENKKNPKPDEIAENVKNGKYVFDKSIKEKLYLEILENCLNFDEAKRFSAQQILELIKDDTKKTKPEEQMPSKSGYKKDKENSKNEEDDEWITVPRKAPIQNPKESNKKAFTSEETTQNAFESAKKAEIEKEKTTLRRPDIKKPAETNENTLENQKLIHLEKDKTTISQPKPKEQQPDDKNIEKIINIEKDKTIIRKPTSTQNPRKPSEKDAKVYACLESGELVRTFEGHTASVRSVVISSDSQKIVSGSWDNTVRLWDLSSGKLLKTFKGHTKSVYSVAISSDSMKIVSGSADNMVNIWDVKTGNRLSVLKGHLNYVLTVAISPDDKKIISGSTDRTIKIWDLQSGNLIMTIDAHYYYVLSVAVSSDNSLIISGSADKTILVWDLQTGELLRKFDDTINNWIYSVAISNDNQRIIFGCGDDTIKILDLNNSLILETYDGHSSYVYSVAISPDNKKIVSCSLDKTIKIWDVEGKSGVPAKILEGHANSVWSVAISSDNLKIVSGSSDGTIKLWKL